MPQPLDAAAKKAIKADPRFENLVQCIHMVWQQIGSDWEQCVERMDNLGRLEGCLDAGRMTSFLKEDGKKADDFAGELFKLYGWTPVLRMIGKEVVL